MEDFNMDLNKHPSNSSCLICLENLNLDSSSSSSSWNSNLKSRQEICVRFSTSVSKFIEMNKKLDIIIDISQVYTSLPFFNQDKDITTKKKELQMCCENCFLSLEQFCNNYEQLQMLHKELLQTLHGIFLNKEPESAEVKQHQEAKRITTTLGQDSSHVDDDDPDPRSNDLYYDAGDYNHDDDDDEGNFEVDMKPEIIMDLDATTDDVNISKGEDEEVPLTQKKRKIAFKAPDSSDSSGIFRRRSKRKSFPKTKIDPHFGFMSTLGGSKKKLRYRCLMCRTPKFLRTEQNLLEHMGQHTGEKIICPVCQMELQSKIGLKLHQVRNHRPNITNPSDFIICHICKLTFDGEFLLNRHRREDHNVWRVVRNKRENIELGEPFSCNLCDFKGGYSKLTVNWEARDSIFSK